MCYFKLFRNASPDKEREAVFGDHLVRTNLHETMAKNKMMSKL